MRKRIILSFLIFTGVLSISSRWLTPGSSIPGYDLTAPVSRTVLPEILHEISGLTETGPETFACIQDENGVLFIVNVEKNTIEKKIPFGLDGDYEGVCRVENKIFVLRS